MAAKKNTATEKDTAAKGQVLRTFSRAQILASGRYQDRQDLVSALLQDGRAYGIEEVDKLVEEFLKGKVN